jgi:hypothetical protein
MYCSHCGGEIFYKDLSSEGWCGRCDNIVSTWDCKVPYWHLMATFTMAWIVLVGF